MIQKTMARWPVCEFGTVIWHTNSCRIGEEGGREWWLTVQIHFQPVLTSQRLDKKGGADSNLQV